MSTLKIAAAFLAVCAMSRPVGSATFWETRNVLDTDTDLRKNVTFDGTKSVVKVPGGGKPHRFTRWTRFADLEHDRFVLELGKTSPWIEWEIVRSSQSTPDEWKVLASGRGGGGRTHKVSLAGLGLPSWAMGAHVGVRVRSDKDGTMEIRRWAIETETPSLGKFAAQFDRTARELASAHASPLERGITRHWNPQIGGFVCTFNSTHPEHYNYWLEDEGEQLWSFGNYPLMMKLYGRRLRDFIVEHCKQGFPVRKVNNQPLAAEPVGANGEFRMDTGILDVEGRLAEDPQINLHHSAYETFGLLARIGSFFVSYSGPDGVGHTFELTKPSSWSVSYHRPGRNCALLSVKQSDESLDAAFDVVVYRGRVTVGVKVTNKNALRLTNVRAGFALLDCEKYYRRPLRAVKRFGDVALLYAVEMEHENSNIVRLAGPAARGLKTYERDGLIEKATASATVAPELAPGASASMTLAGINAGAKSFAAKIEAYRDIDFEDADISLSYVGTYALLGLATYSYRFPEDKEARDLTNLMIDSFLAARDRSRNRELAYLLWVLSLYGRDKDAKEIADLIEKRAAGQGFHSMDNSGMALALRRAGRWDAADDLCSRALEPWTGGVAAPTDFLGYGALQSPRCLDTCLRQLSRALVNMAWNAPDRFTAPGAQECGCYMLVVYDVLSRLYGGIVPVRLGSSKDARVTSLDYDEQTGEWRIGLAGADLIEIYTHFRPPRMVEWNGAALDRSHWAYDSDWGLIRVTGLSGDGTLAVAVVGPPPKDDPAWPPIDYVGIQYKR